MIFLIWVSLNTIPTSLGRVVTGADTLMLLGLMLKISQHAERTVLGGSNTREHVGRP